MIYCIDLKIKVHLTLCYLFCYSEQIWTFVLGQSLTKHFLSTEMCPIVTRCNWIGLRGGRADTGSGSLRGHTGDYAAQPTATMQSKSRRTKTKWLNRWPVVDTYLSHLCRGTLSQCCAPAGEALKKTKNTSPQWGVGGVILVWCKNVFCYMSQICHISCNVFHEFCKKWQHFLIN